MPLDLGCESGALQRRRYDRRQQRKEQRIRGVVAVVGVAEHGQRAHRPAVHEQRHGDLRRDVVHAPPRRGLARGLVIVHDHGVAGLERAADGRRCVHCDQRLHVLARAYGGEQQERVRGRHVPAQDCAFAPRDLACPLHDQVGESVRIAHPARGHGHVVQGGHRGRMQLRPDRSLPHLGSHPAIPRVLYYVSTYIAI